MIVTLVVTHPMPDCDALTAAGALWWCLAPAHEPSVSFASHDLDRYQIANGAFVVDIGRGPLDHHQLPSPRATCAFELVLHHIIQHGAPAQVQRAHALLPLVPFVLRQDASGRMFDDAETQRISLPAIINRRVWSRQNDMLAWYDLWPLIEAVFHAVAFQGVAPEQILTLPALLPLLAERGYPMDEALLNDLTNEAVARITAEANPHGLCDWFGVTVVGDVAYYDICQSAGGFSSGQYLRQAIETAYPQVRIIVSLTRWFRPRVPNETLSWSRTIGRTRAGRGLDSRDLVAIARAELPEFAAEFDSWYQEVWFSGTGAAKYPRADPPPEQFVRRVALALAERCM